MSCYSCHGSPPNYVDRSPKGNAHDRHTAFACQTCHATVTTDGTTIADRSRHMNKTYDVVSDGSFPFAYSFSAGVGSCSNVSCHVADRKNLNWRYARDECYTTSFTPAYGTANVPVSTQISVLFPEDMDPASITADTFKVDNGVT